MNEAERLQKIVEKQETEIRRLRKLMSVARVAQADFYVTDGTLQVVVTAIGVDEYHFTEQARPELEKIAEAIIEAKRGQVQIPAGGIKDMLTGEPAQGAVIPEP
jgi:hypothetical protein